MTDRTQGNEMTDTDSARRPGLRGSSRRWVGVLLVGLMMVGPGGRSSIAVLADDSTPPPIVAGSTPVPMNMPIDLRRPTYEPCDAAPRDFDDVMSILDTVLFDPSGFPLPKEWATEVRETSDGPVSSYELPIGGPVGAPEIAELTTLTGRYLNCSTTLSNFGYVTDDCVVRAGLLSPGSGFLMVSLWNEAHEAAMPAPSYPEPITDGNGSQIQAPVAPSYPGTPDRTGQQADSQLYGFRAIDASHVGAYVEIAGSISIGDGQSIEPTFQQTGFVVFAWQPDERWLIDQFVSPYATLSDRFAPSEGATPAA